MPYNFPSSHPASAHAPHLVLAHGLPPALGQLRVARARCSSPRRGEGQRRGAVAVEFACVAPLMLAVIVGLVELSRVYNAQNVLETAAREGARFAGLDRSGLMLQNQTSNQKLIKDIKNYLGTQKINPSAVTVKVVRADDPTQDFDLDDPDNSLDLFQVRIEVPYNEICQAPFKKYEQEKLSAVLTYRNSRSQVQSNP